MVACEYSIESLEVIYVAVEGNPAVAPLVLARAANDWNILLNRQLFL